MRYNERHHILGECCGRSSGLKKAENSEINIWNGLLQTQKGCVCKGARGR